MHSKEECEIALEHLIECKQRKLCDKCKFKLRCTMSNDELVINQLIEEHFEPKENTSEFKHFKLHSDSALKNLKKNELIDYIKMLYHNWGVCDGQLKNCIDKAKELSDSNDKLRRKRCFRLTDAFIRAGTKYYRWFDLSSGKLVRERFIEGQLYPPTKAMEYQEGN